MRVLAVLLLAALGWGAPTIAAAEADGPDFYRVQGVPAGATIELRAEPRANAAVIGRLSPDAQCLRSLGCRGGLSFREFNSLSPEEQKRRAALNPRWCRVQQAGTSEQRGASGWVEGRFLAEAACPAAAANADARVRPVDIAEGGSPKLIRAQIRGREYVDFLVNAGAGQTLSVSMKASNRQNYFNVLPPRSQAAMFIGSTSGNEFSGMLPVEGDYVVRVYLMRAAARRNESSRYSLSLALQGKPLAALPESKDALVPGTSYHASANVSCRAWGDQVDVECPAHVIRRSFDGTATVEIRRADGYLRRVLFVKGKPVSSDSPNEISISRRSDNSVVLIGNDERMEIPDAFLTGG